ncbi:MAG: helix-turn-helix transcriptional regulator [Paludibacteraceae bacterium]|nr:helix-turn-helix transcriptional regulator [Eubacterium sp.]MBR1630485.1 helix-turn-helix transcriptional regulator [Paludibacteraceae bacterium]
MANSQNDTRLKIAGLLKFYRERAGLTIREAGALIGKSNQTVSAWENGRGQPDADMFLKLCDVYHVESVSVFFGEQPPTPELSVDELELLDLWRESSDAGRESALMVLRCNKKQ